MKIYIGIPEQGPSDIAGDVFVSDDEDRALGVIGNGDRLEDHEKLEPRLDLVNHSPTGFAWNYNGSGPAQLALAILCDHIGNDDEALRFYMSFKDQVIATLGEGGFIITANRVSIWLENARANT